MAEVKRRRYTEDFKREAVRLVRESARPVAQVARDLGIPDNVWYRWAAQHTEAEELTRVKRELARVTQERDFLQRRRRSSRGSPHEIPRDPRA